MSARRNSHEFRYIFFRVSEFSAGLFADRLLWCGVLKVHNPRGESVGASHHRRFDSFDSEVEAFGIPCVERCRHRHVSAIFAVFFKLRTAVLLTFLRLAKLRRRAARSYMAVA